MRHPARLTLLAITLLIASTALAQERRAPTLDDLLNLVQVSGAEISPDGTQVIYSKSEIKKWSDNKRVATIWIANSDGSDDRQLLGSDKDRSPQWSPDGRHVAFLSTRDQSENARDAAGAQLWLLRISGGGEATKLSDLKTAVRSFKWSEDSSRIFFVTEEAPSDEEKEARKNGDDAIFVDEGGNGQGRNSFANAWVIALAEKQARQLTKGNQIVTDFAPSPDGKRLAYVSRPNNRRNFQNLAELHVLDLAGDTVTRLTENEAPELRVAWSPDGTQVTYLAPDDKQWELAQEKLFSISPSGGAPRPLAAGFAGDIGQYYWHPSGKTIVLNTTMRGRRGVHELDVATGRVRAVVTGDVAIMLSSVSGGAAKGAGTKSTPSDPDEIVIVDLTAGQTANVTHANPWFKPLETAQLRAITWKSNDGLDVEGLLWLPASYKAGDKLPFLLSIHGGPAGVWATSFRGINHVYASLGWAVLEPNVRGSTSYGDALLRGNMKDIGGGDYHDAMTGVDALVTQGIADPAQLAVRGWSYGGILGGWTITQTQRFKAASLGAMVSDWSSEYAMGFNHDISRWYIGGRPWDNAEAYRRQSAYTHIAKVTTPTILLHGEQDDTDTIGQSMIFYQGLKDRGVPARFIRFPREPPGLREPHHLRIRDAEEISWLMKYTRGIEWKAPERKDVKDEKKVTSTQ